MTDEASGGILYAYSEMNHKYIRLAKMSDSERIRIRLFLFWTKTPGMLPGRFLFDRKRLKEYFHQAFLYLHLFFRRDLVYYEKNGSGL